jgi:hypothetical protein
MNVDSHSPGTRKDFSTSQLKLIRRTVARACSDAEFDEFISVAVQCGLDPMRRPSCSMRTTWIAAA